jgi:hypothetical protein
LAAVVVAVLAGLQCHGKTPTNPSVAECSTSASFQAIDQLLFQISTPNIGGVVGASVLSYEPGQSPVSLGAIQQCTIATQNKCVQVGSPTICFEPADNGGRVQIFNRTEWTPVRLWSISVGTIEERDADGSLHASDSRTVVIPAGGVD